MEQIGRRIDANRRYLEKLAAAPSYRFDDKLRSLLPEKPGIYRIIITSSQVTLRAGTTKSSDSLRQRVYQNHLMGNQTGNIRSQLVRAGMCKDLDAAKSFLQSSCSVQWIVIEDKEERKWAEHFVLAVLQPTFSD